MGPLAGAVAVATAVFATTLAFSVRELAGPIRWTHPDATALRDVGWEHGMARWELLRIGAASLIAVAAVTAGIPPVSVIAAGLGPSIWVRFRAEAARERARRSLGRVLTAVETALRSGLSLPDAIQRGVDAAGERLATAPLAEALVAFDLGSSLHEALERAAVSARDERWRVVLTTLAVGIAERLPRDRIADLLGRISQRVAFEDGIDDEVRARSAGARQQQRLLAVTVPALALYLAATMPGLAATLGSEVGRSVLVPAAATLQVAGVILSRRVMRGVTS